MHFHAIFKTYHYTVVIFSLLLLTSCGGEVTKPNLKATATVYQYNNITPQVVSSAKAYCNAIASGNTGTAALTGSINFSKQIASDVNTFTSIYLKGDVIDTSFAISSRCIQGSLTNPFNYSLPYDSTAFDERGSYIIEVVSYQLKADGTYSEYGGLLRFGGLPTLEITF